MPTDRDDAQAWNARFAQPGFFFGTEPNAFLVRHVELLTPGQSVLAVADGEGRNGVFLAERGMTVTSFDISDVAVRKAVALATARGVAVDTHLDSIDTWEWQPERFDAVVAIFIQFAPPDVRDRAFAGMLRTVRRGGLVLLQGYTPRQLEFGTGGPPFVEHMYTADLLRTAFADHDVMVLDEHDAHVAEGTGHHGMSALIDCVVRKGPADPGRLSPGRGGSPRG